MSISSLETETSSSPRSHSRLQKSVSMQQQAQQQHKRYDSLGTIPSERKSPPTRPQLPASWFNDPPSSTRHSHIARQGRISPQNGAHCRELCSGKHVFVLCHGYQGNSWDMRLFKNHLEVMCPKALYLVSISNEGKTEVKFFFFFPKTSFYLFIFF